MGIVKLCCYLTLKLQKTTRTLLSWCVGHVGRIGGIEEIPEDEAHLDIRFMTWVALGHQER